MFKLPAAVALFALSFIMNFLCAVILYFAVVDVEKPFSRATSLKAGLMLVATSALAALAVYLILRVGSLAE